jgi:peroxiredoxin (alkyl hydroperoxide reductase subunit C)
MMKQKRLMTITLCVTVAVFFLAGLVYAQGGTCKNVYNVGNLKPRDSVSTLKIGDKAPEFTLSAVDGNKVSLSQYLGKKNVVISFVPAAWTPVCSAQWPAYDMSEDIFRDNNAMLLGITVDNIPTLYAWTKELAANKDKLWFPVLSDFFPHGEVAKKYGVLRSGGVSERALFVIDKEGIIRYIDIHDINDRPLIPELQKELEALKK